MPVHDSSDALTEFGEGGTDQEIVQSLGNLLLIERSINRSVVNGPYSDKTSAYAQSKFLLTKCQSCAQAQLVGAADKITLTVKTLKSWPVWTAKTVQDRQIFLAQLAMKVWEVPDPAAAQRA
jgi:hypothetical protein